jgi:hypothetical protein
MIFNAHRIETLTVRFTRRHTWSNDGSLLLLVAGVYNDKDKNIVENVVWGFTRKNLSSPAFLLPTLDKSPVCARFCPIIFKKTETIEKGKTVLIKNLSISHINWYLQLEHLIQYLSMILRV